MTETLKSTKKIVRIACALFLIFFIFFAFTLLPLQVRAANTSVATIPVGGRPFGLAITPNGAYVYVANQLDGSVSVISTATNTVTDTITGLSGASWVAITPNGQYAYVIDEEGVSVISTATNLVTTTITCDAWAGIAVTPDGAYVYVSDFYDGTVLVISTATNTVTAVITGLVQPGDLAITPNGAEVYIVSGNYGTVAVISTATNTVTTTLTGFNQPYGVAITLDGEYAYVTNYDGCTVSAINTSSNTVATTIDLNYPSFRIGPTDVEMTPDGAYAYVVSEGNGIISVISLATNTVVAAITGLTGADLMAITPNGAYAYISLFMESNTTDVINVLPAANVSPSSWTMDVGQSVQFTANPTDGSGTYTSYQWYVDGVAQSDQTASTFSFVPVSAGSYSITATVTDSSDATSAPSFPATVTVESVLTAPIITPTPASVDRGYTISLTATAVATGTSPYTYQWLEQMPGASTYSAISGATSSSYPFTTTGATAIGSWNFELQVTDSANTPVKVTSAPVSVVVNVDPSVSISPGSATLDVGSSSLFTAIPGGGSGTYASYQWFADGTAQSGQTASTFSFSPSFAGSYAITVTVTDSLGITSAQSTAARVTVNSALVAPTVSAFKSTIEQSQDSTLTSTSITTGTSPYTYQWFESSPKGSNTPVGSNSASFDFATSTSTAPGVWNFILQITDSAGATISSSAVSVSVNSALVAPTVSASEAAVNPGQTSSLTSSAVTTGTSPYTYQWLEMAPSGSYAVVGSNSGSFSFVSSSVSAIGSWSFILQVTDNAGVSINSSAVSVTVNPTPTPTPTPTPSPTPAPTVTPSPTPASSSSTTQSPTATPTTTATPISTPTPTQSLTPASTSTSSPNTTSSPTPAVPEFTSAIIVMALFITATTVMLFYTKKPKK